MIELPSGMKEVLEFLNLFGGLVGILSLVLSIVIWYTTGNIKKSVIQSREIEGYKGGKKQAIKKLSELSSSIEADNIRDNRIKTELLQELNRLSKYKVFLDWRARWYIWCINATLKSSSINNTNADKIVSYVAKLCGRMSVDPVDQKVG